MKTVEYFANRYSAIILKDAIAEYRYFTELGDWLSGAPRGTLKRLADRLNRSLGTLSKQVRASRRMSRPTILRVAHRGWTWSEIVLLSSVPAAKRHRAITMAIDGESALRVFAFAWPSQTPEARRRRTFSKQDWLDMSSRASPTQIVNWMSDLLQIVGEHKAEIIRRGLSPLVSPPPSRAQRVNGNGNGHDTTHVFRTPSRPEARAQ